MNINELGWFLKKQDGEGRSEGMTGSFSDYIHESMIFFRHQLAHLISSEISRTLATRKSDTVPLTQDCQILADS